MQVTPANSLVTLNKGRQLVICNRQTTELDRECTRLDKSGNKSGSRVFTDCDILMKCILRYVARDKKDRKIEAE